MNQFIANWNISELLTFLRANPLKFKVYKGDKELTANTDYIFIDLTGYSPITFDDGGIQKANLTINVYANSYLYRQKVVEYLNTKLFGSVTFRRDDEYFVATIQRSIFLDESK